MSDGDAAAAGCVAGPGCGPTALPHPGQNLAFCGTATPQLVQYIYRLAYYADGTDVEGISRGAPQILQNRASAGMGSAQ
jgi:hypothetical protein